MGDLWVRVDLGVGGLGSIRARFVFVVTELFVCIQFLGFIFFITTSRFDFDFWVSFSTSTTWVFYGLIGFGCGCGWFGFDWGSVCVCGC